MSYSNLLTGFSGDDGEVHPANVTATFWRQHIANQLIGWRQGERNAISGTTPPYGFAFNDTSSAGGTAYSIEAGELILFRSGDTPLLAGAAGAVDATYFLHQSLNASQLISGFTVPHTSGDLTITSLMLAFGRTGSGTTEKDFITATGGGTHKKLAAGVSFTYSYTFGISPEREAYQTYTLNAEEIVPLALTFKDASGSVVSKIETSVLNLVSGAIAGFFDGDVKAIVEQNTARVSMFAGMKIPSNIVVTLSDMAFDFTVTPPVLRFHVALGTMGGTVVERIQAANPSTKTTNCFIATAAFGTPFAAEVETLRAFRDRFLTRGAGAAFVRAYYRFAPPVAALVERSPWLAAVVRRALLPVTRAARAALLRWG
ncbi:MAG: hypothetical protein JO103_15770 [Candidatus Eremiobacteraeota bacterium]|nr:hypothetical protein [Candidatus Eremiobacteraeota bacterium]